MRRFGVNDREALLLSLFAWFGLIVALVILFPAVTGSPQP